MIINGGVFSGGTFRDLPTIPEILSPAGQAAYAAASVGSFYEVSASDYASVASLLPNTTKIGMTDSQTNEDSASSWSPSYAITLPQANSTVPVNNYMIGFVSAIKYAVSTTLSIYAGTTYRGSYSLLGSPAPAVSTIGKHYFLLKKPTVFTSATYVSIYAAGTGAGLVQGTTSFAGAYSSSPFTSWTAQTGGMPIFQSLITTTAT